MKDIMQIGKAINSMDKPAKVKKPATTLKTVVVVPTSGSDSYEIEVEKLSLEEAQRLVGGYVRRIGLDSGACLLCDEDGRHKNLPVNRDIGVTLLSGMHAPLVGTVLIVPKGCGF